MRHIKNYKWVILGGLMVMLFLANISMGSVAIPLSDTLFILFGKSYENKVWENIVFDFRLTKALTCVLVGSSLSLGGLLMQTLFRNPLAGPDILGLSSGASLAVAVLVMTGGSISFALASPFSVVLAASIGSGLIFILIFAVAQRVHDNTSLLLIGLMIGAATSALVSVLQFISRTEDQHYFLIWTFGSLGNLNWTEIGVLSIFFVIGLVISLAVSKPLNAWLLGNNYAQSIGINLQKTRMLLIICTSLLAGSVTAFCGPIGFVGLAVPHLTRLLINTTNHRQLIPGVIMGGAALMLFCDTISQLPGSSYVLPINAITAFIGAPVVIWVIIRSKKIWI